MIGIVNEGVGKQFTSSSLLSSSEAWTIAEMSWRKVLLGSGLEKVDIIAMERVAASKLWSLISVEVTSELWMEIPLRIQMCFK